MYGRFTTVEFGSASQRHDALGFIGDTVQVLRSMPGFEAAYYLDVDELRIVVVTIFDSEEALQAIDHEDEALRGRARSIGVTFPRTDQYPVMAFAVSGAP